MKYPDDPGYQQTDTSYAAAEDMKLSAGTLRKYVLDELLKSAGGLTADECAERLGESILSIRPRFSELRNFNLIKDSGWRSLNKSGKRAIIWVINSKDENDGP